MNKHTPLHPVPPCPNHPDSNMVRAHVEEDVFGNLRLTRYVCAAGCSTHLSWQFHRTNDNVFAYGVGRCEDPRVLEAFRQARYSNKTDALVFGLATPVIFLVVFAVFKWDALPMMAQVSSVAGAILFGGGAIYALVHRLRRKPVAPTVEVRGTE